LSGHRLRRQRIDAIAWDLAHIDDRRFSDLADSIAAGVSRRLGREYEVLVERVAPTPPIRSDQRYVCFYRGGENSTCRVEARQQTTAFHMHIERDRPAEDT
tara:strand:- start:225 stop:527 length:303 start_codon:yes stop_codon:yes gene_type:complete